MTAIERLEALSESLTGGLQSITIPGALANQYASALREALARIRELEARQPAPVDAVALSASDRACYEYPGILEQPLRAAFVAGAESYAAPIPDQSRLREAAQAVVDRWDGPHWKGAAPTAHVINRLRQALSPPPTGKAL